MIVSVGQSLDSLIAKIRELKMGAMEIEDWETACTLRDAEYRLTVLQVAQERRSKEHEC